MATVPEIITQQLLTADTYIAQADGFINQVANLANTEFAISIPTTIGFGGTDYTNDALDRMNNLTPARPATFGTIEAIAPNAPVINLREIDQDLIDAVKLKLLEDLENGGYGIEPDDEAALWNRERDREAQQALADEEEVARQFAQGGFSIPTGAMLNAVSAAQQRAANKISSVNRDIALKRADLYVENRKFTIQNAQSAEQVLVALHAAITNQIQAQTIIFNAQIAKYRADIDGQSEVIRSNVAVYSADVSAFRTSVEAIAAAYKLKNEENQLNNSWNVDVIRAKLEEAKTRLGGQEASAKIRYMASQFGADFYGRTIQAALNSINALAAQTSQDA